MTAKEFYDYIIDVNQGINNLQTHRDKIIQQHCKENNIEYAEFEKRYIKFLSTNN